MTHTIDDQVDQILLGSGFGDRQLADTMANELRTRLTEAAAQRRPLRVYAGYDPSKPDLHLGHSITMRKLRQFQDFGHDVIFVVGTFTAQVGDTSDKTTGRARLAVESIRAAAQSYARQAFSILDQERTTVAYNDEWLSALTMTDVANLASHFTVQQFLERDNYRRRLANGDPVGLHEFLYPLLQGYDAVHLRADVQLGATEQLFNIMAGRKLQQAFGQRGCVCLTYPILVGTDGVERMSKSKGNYIGIAEPADEQFGKTMSISDATMRQWLPLVTRWSPAEVTDRLRRLDTGDLHPMECKKQLAYEIVFMYHGEQEAGDARARFESLHQRRELPDKLVEYSVPAGATVIEALTSSGAAESRSAARRLVAGRGVRLDGTVVVDPESRIDSDSILHVGKRRFFRLSVHK
ncbi:MAG: tyrosine--tRNA ligase [Pseudonocardiaceae bacterium]